MGPELLTLPDQMSSTRLLVWVYVALFNFYVPSSTNQKQELPVAAMFVNGSGRNEQSL
jgi:hypothetical protein